MRLRRLLVFISACLLTVGFVYTVYESVLLLPTERRIHSLERRLGRSEERVQQARAMTDHREAFAEERTGIDLEMETLEAVFPRTNAPDLAIERIRELAREAGLEPTGFAVQPARDRDFYRETVVRFAVVAPTPEALSELARRINLTSPIRKVIALDLDAATGRVVLGVGLYGYLEVELAGR